MKRIQVVSVNISEKKGTIKNPVQRIHLFERGVEGDAHNGPGQRQVSLLGVESIGRFGNQAGRSFQFGEFAENITTAGLELFTAHPLDRFVNDSIELEVTQIGKSCHGDACAIFREVGNCVMPKEGIFARVIRPGYLQAGDELEYQPKEYRVKVITLSDRAYAGDYEDKSGPRTLTLLRDWFGKEGLFCKPEGVVIPDSPEMLEALLKESAGYDLVVTTGGTGIGPRDFTPEVIRKCIDKEIPGIMDMIRMKYGQQKINALVSRSIAGVSGKCLVFAIPGSVNAVNEYLTEILKGLKHMIYMQHGLDMHG